MKNRAQILNELGDKNHEALIEKEAYNSQKNFINACEKRESFTIHEITTANVLLQFTFELGILAACYNGHIDILEYLLQWALKKETSVCLTPELLNSLTRVAISVSDRTVWNKETPYAMLHALLSTNLCDESFDKTLKNLACVKNDLWNLQKIHNLSLYISKCQEEK